MHGFTQTGRCWGAFADDLARDHELVLVDAPGHGGSATVEADLPTGARLLGDVGGTAAYVGYSMGGRLALHLALARPDLVTRLVLIGATGGIDDPAERADPATRRRAPWPTISRPSASRRSSTSGWPSPSSPGSPRPPRPGTNGWPTPPPGLASSLRLAGTGTQEPLWDRLGSIDVPVLVMAGVDDAKFSAVAGRLARADRPQRHRRRRPPRRPQRPVREPGRHRLDHPPLAPRPPRARD